MGIHCSLVSREGRAEEVIFFILVTEHYQPKINHDNKIIKNCNLYMIKTHNIFVEDLKYHSQQRTIFTMPTDSFHWKLWVKQGNILINSSL